MTINTSAGISAYQNTMATANVGTKKTTDEEKEKEVSAESTSSKSSTDSFEISKEAQATRAKEMIEAHNETQAQNLANMLNTMMGQQANIAGVSSKSAYSSLSSLTPEEAAYNVSEDGDLGVSAVADDIMNMALTFAGDDPEMLEKMKEAVIKGFELAGMDIDSEGNASGLPSVSINTFEEVMKRFDYAAENGNSLDGYVYTAYDDSGRTATLSGASGYSTRDSWASE